MYRILYFVRNACRSINEISSERTRCNVPINRKHNKDIIGRNIKHLFRTRTLRDSRRKWTVVLRSDDLILVSRFMFPELDSPSCYTFLKNIAGQSIQLTDFGEKF